MSNDSEGSLHAGMVLNYIDNLRKRCHRKKFDKARRKANEQLLLCLSILIDENPEQRFSQILQNYGFIQPLDVTLHQSIKSAYKVWKNEFNAEPQQVLERVRAAMSAYE